VVDLLRGDSALLDAAKKGNLSRVQKLVRNGCRVILKIYILKNIYIFAFATQVDCPSSLINKQIKSDCTGYMQVFFKLRISLNYKYFYTWYPICSVRRTSTVVTRPVGTVHPSIWQPDITT
jgi:hypothetical protein